MGRGRMQPPGLSLPPILFHGRRASAAPQEESELPPKNSHRYVTHAAPGATADLRDLASQQADRRHTLIQLELAAAHFETRMTAGQGADPEFSAASAWDEYVTSEAHKRSTVKKSRRSLKTQLEALSQYMDMRGSLRRGAQTSSPLKDLRSSELRKFEVLRKQVASERRHQQGGSGRALPTVHVRASPRAHGTSASQGAVETLQRRRKSVALLPPLLMEVARRGSAVLQNRRGSVAPQAQPDTGRRKSVALLPPLLMEVARRGSVVLQRRRGSVGPQAQSDTGAKQGSNKPNKAKKMRDAVHAARGP